MTQAERELRCAHCGCQDFNHRRAQLNTALATFFNLDAFDASADVYACRRCGRLEWFIAPDAEYLAATAAPAVGQPAVECPRCNMIVKRDVSRCVCGWTR